MKFIRSSKCSLKFANPHKLDELNTTLLEYGNVVNCFINNFWLKPLPRKAELLKSIVDTPTTWLSARLRKVAAREAIDMINASVSRDADKAVIPVHKGTRMYVSSTIANLLPNKQATEFDSWLHLASIGNKINLQLPIKLHKHFLKLQAEGKRLASYVITKDYVQFAFEFTVDKKKTEGILLGIDTGIKSLATLSNGTHLGTDIEANITRINCCKHGSKGQKRARRALKQRIDEVAKEVMELEPRLIVVEQLKGISHKTKLKGKLSKKMRKVVGAWTWRYWLDRLQQQSERGRSSYRSVPAYNTSITCPSCSHIDKGNRLSQSVFKCLSCGYEGNADETAAINILKRFTTGHYGACFKHEDIDNITKCNNCL